jgi:hypothetical protein
MTGQPTLKRSDKVVVIEHQAFFEAFILNIDGQFERREIQMLELRRCLSSVAEKKEIQR